MIILDSNIWDALQTGPFVHRTFIWLVARNRTTGEAVPDGYWNDHGKITVPIKDPETGVVENREFHGSGGLISVDEIPRVLNVTVQRVDIRMTNLASRVNDLLRTYDLKLAPIAVFRGL